MFGQRWEESDLGPATLEHLDLAVERFGLSYLHTPPDQLFREVRDCRQRVSSMVAGRQTLSQRRHLCVVGGWLSGLLGHLALDIGDGGVAHAHCVTAWQLAAESGDAQLGAWVRGTQAMIAFYAGDAADALRFSRAGWTSRRSARPPARGSSRSRLGRTRASVTPTGSASRSPARKTPTTR
jgi:hypothetical protein